MAPGDRAENGGQALGVAPASQAAALENTVQNHP